MNEGEMLRALVAQIQAITDKQAALEQHLENAVQRWQDAEMRVNEWHGAIMRMHGELEKLRERGLLK